MVLLRLLWQVPVALILLVVFLFSMSGYAISVNSRRTKDVPYILPTAPDFSAERHVLDIYTPRGKSATGRPVVVFIHGGAWNSGNKNIYWFIGRRLAKQGVVTVIINYRLSPNVQVPAMADDCARAVQWVTQHIGGYGGDPNRIFVMGHSAGGGLAALLATDTQLFARLGMTKNPVKGAILDDAAGLDMFGYLTKMEYPGDESYLVAYGKVPAVWRTVSPIYFVGASSPPMLVYVGENTYPSILDSSKRFRQRLQEFGIKHEFATLPGKKHIPMATQLFWKNNIIYRDLLKFVGATS
ncbi:alpha/beta hydrolase [Spirosoma sp. KCTC 42546]|uniref:alpha/beta hydrolase n=1 Tax=Spirosoma sp. KCTC 42546 TaxID=2520506 RepID=UPI00115C3D73|nr:alpha/beta hydrolase [Spirosoma sp. KCTC 42546]QDK83843.1 alpha/beta hydrolase [Spirosoma sp. KCTC 42546]